VPLTVPPMRLAPGPFSTGIGLAGTPSTRPRRCGPRPRTPVHRHSLARPHPAAGRRAGAPPAARPPRGRPGRCGGPSWAPGPRAAGSRRWSGFRHPDLQPLGRAATSTRDHGPRVSKVRLDRPVRGCGSLPGNSPGGHGGGEAVEVGGPRRPGRSGVEHIRAAVRDPDCQARWKKRPAAPQHYRRCQARAGAS